MEFIHEPFEHHHPHHHHEVSPLELAQIGGASQYAKLSWRLQKHIEDNVRHITDEERYKWNKAYNDLKSLKEDIEDGNIGGNVDLNAVKDLLDQRNYATQGWVNDKLGDYYTKSYIDNHFGNLNDYIKKNDILFKYNGQSVRQGDEITGSTNAGSKTSVTYTSNIAAGTAGQYTLGTLTVDGTQYPIVGHDVIGSGGGGTGDPDTYRYADPYFISTQSDTEAPITPIIASNGIDINYNGWSTSNVGQSGNGWYVWMCWIIFKQEGNGVVPVDVSDPICITGSDGNPGADSNGAEFIYRTSRTPYNASLQTLWSPNTQTTGVIGSTGAPGTYADEDFVPNGWNDNPSGVSKEVPYEYMCVRASKLVNGKRVWEANFSDPLLWSKWGQDGTDGDGIEYIFSQPVSLLGYPSAEMDKLLTHHLNLLYKQGSSEFDKTYVNSSSYQSAREVVDQDTKKLPMPETTFNNIKTWYDDPYTGDSQDGTYKQGDAIYCAMRKWTIDPETKEGKWSAFSTPQVWSYYAVDGKAGESNGNFYALQATPSRVKKTGDGKFFMNGTYSDTAVVTVQPLQYIEGIPTAIDPEGTTYTTYISVNGAGEQTIANCTQAALSGKTIRFTVDSTVAQVAFNLRNNDGVLLSNVTVTVDVDGSILSGEDGTVIELYNDNRSIGCDSENVVMSIPNESSIAKAYYGSEQLDVVAVEINGTSCTSSDTSYKTAIYPIDGNVNVAIRMQVIAEADSGNKVGDIRISSITNANGANGAKLNNIQTVIPVKVTARTSFGKEFYRTCSLSLTRINSGEPGVAPVMYSLFIEGDIVHKTPISNGVQYDRSYMSGYIFKYTTTWIPITSLTQLTNDGVFMYLSGVGDNPTYINVTNNIAFNGPKFTIQNSSYSVGRINNRLGESFAIQLTNASRSIIYDSEGVSFVSDGKDGEAGSSGAQGLQGCVIRASLLSDGLQAAGTTYRNDENLVSNTTVTRYIDVVGVPWASAPDGYRWYKVTSSPNGEKVIRAGNGVGFPESLNVNVTGQVDYASGQIGTAPATYTRDFEYLTDAGAIYSSLIVAKYAKIRFLSNNELTVVNEDDYPVAGITGGGNKNTADKNVRIWAGDGGGDPDALNLKNAAFKVYEDGSVVATKGDVVGNFGAGTVAASECMAGPNGSFIINKDGSGYVAFGNISWNKYGKVTISGADIVDCNIIGGNDTEVVVDSNPSDGTGSTNGSDDASSTSVKKLTIKKIKFSNTTGSNGIANGAVKCDFEADNANSVDVDVMIAIWSESADVYTGSTGQVIPVWTAMTNYTFTISGKETDVQQSVTFDKGWAHGENYDSSPLNEKRYSESIMSASWVSIKNVISKNATAKKWTDFGIWGD